MTKTAKATETQELPSAISQDSLSRILSLRKEVDQAEKELKVLEGTVKAQLDAALPTEAGPLESFFRVTARRHVSWRTVVERLESKGYAENVLKHTKPSETRHLEIDLVKNF